MRRQVGGGEARRATTPFLWPGAWGLGPGAWGLGHGAWGLGHGAWGMGPGAWGLGHGAWGLGRCWLGHRLVSARTAGHNVEARTSIRAGPYEGHDLVLGTQCVVEFRRI